MPGWKTINTPKPRVPTYSGVGKYATSTPSQTLWGCIVSAKYENITVGYGLECEWWPYADKLACVVQNYSWIQPGKPNQSNIRTIEH